MATQIAQRHSYRRWRPAPYEQMRETFRWEVPARYNIAADVLDKHEPSRPAMYWEDWQGNERSLTFGDMQALTNRTANALRAYGVREGDRVAVMLPPLPEAAATFLATYKLGAILLSLSILYGDDSIAHRLRDCSAKVIVTDATNRERIDRIRDVLPELEHVLVVDEEFGRSVERAFHAGVTFCGGGPHAFWLTCAACAPVWVTSDHSSWCVCVALGFETKARG